MVALTAVAAGAPLPSVVRDVGETRGRPKRPDIVASLAPSVSDADSEVA